MEGKSPERKFLHDISTPIGTSLFLVDILLEKMKSENPENPDVTQLSDLMESLLVAKRLIESRRAVIAEEQKGATKTGE